MPNLYKTTKPFAAALIFRIEQNLPRFATSIRFHPDLAQTGLATATACGADFKHLQKALADAKAQAKIISSPN